MNTPTHAPEGRLEALQKLWQRYRSGRDPADRERLILHYAPLVKDVAGPSLGRRALAEAIDKLPERDRTVIVLYYSEGMTLAQIGEILRVTESRVSQLHTKAVLALRAKLTAALR